MTALDPERLRPSGALLAAQIALGSAIEHRAVSPTGQDPTTMDLLVRLELAAGQRLRAVDLCAQLMKSPSHVSRLLDRAEVSGLVTRQPDPDDRRANQVIITEAGKKLVATFAPDLMAVLNRVIYDSLSRSEIESLVESLARVEAAARAFQRPN